ncbi:YrdB family protein [Arthrobacter sp. H35-D1]|uniref:YrdB family protein n=1 Tax=Arthrobacter sp. H35-D1 TaxID=3046202 RepID=UPI0024B8BA89|nr:YrdB family protein [Arthrobacter sp. H35-D1]MDJ0313008.1 YrdB family protein [Arthrobacter sp. H35-D1]
MGRRNVAGAKAARIDRETITPVVDIATMVLGFVLEVAMLAAFLYWGFQQAAPWDMVLGLGIPVAVVVLWGAFLAPRSARRLPDATVGGVSLALFLAAAAALAGAELAGLAIAMALLSLAHLAATRWVRGSSQN